MRYQGTSLPAVLRLLSAPHGSCMSGDHCRIHTEASLSVDPDAHGHGEGCGCRWRRLKNVPGTPKFALPDQKELSLRIDPTSQKWAAMVGKSFSDLPDGKDSHATSVADDAAAT